MDYLKAFLVGGGLCLIGQIKRVWECKNLVLRREGADKWN